MNKGKGDNKFLEIKLFDMKVHIYLSFLSDSALPFIPSLKHYIYFPEDYKLFIHLQWCYNQLF